MPNIAHAPLALPTLAAVEAELAPTLVAMAALLTSIALEKKSIERWGE